MSHSIVCHAMTVPLHFNRISRMNPDPIIIADAGPLIRLAAAGLLDALKLTNRAIVIVDRVEAEVCGDSSKPFALEIAQWIVRMNGAVEHARTVEGAGIEAMAQNVRTPEELQSLKRKLRHSGERAIREYVEGMEPQDADDALVLYEDRDMPSLMQAATVPMTLMTTRGFVRFLAARGINVDAVAALERIAANYDLKPPVTMRIEQAGMDGGK